MKTQFTKSHLAAFRHRKHNNDELLKTTKSRLKFHWSHENIRQYYQTCLKST